MPGVSWSDVGALASVREELGLSILEPIAYPEVSRRVFFVVSGVTCCLRYEALEALGSIKSACFNKFYMVCFWWRKEYYVDTGMALYQVFSYCFASLDHSGQRHHTNTHRDNVALPPHHCLFFPGQPSAFFYGGKTPAGYDISRFLGSSSNVHWLKSL